MSHAPPQSGPNPGPLNAHIINPLNVEVQADPDAMYGLAPTVKLLLESRELAASMYQALMGGRVRPPAKIG